MSIATPTPSVIEQSEFYSIRVLINHPSWSVAEITARLGEEPDYSSSAGERGNAETKWSRVSDTTGKRFFFAEVNEVLKWIQTKGAFSKELKASGGSLCVIVELPGSVNLGDVLEPEAMQLAVSLGISLGIEVFPKMRRPVVTGT